MHIRPEQPADIPAISELNIAAFGGTAEADLVDALREHAHPHLSLVAVRENAIVGHIMFSPASLVDHLDIIVVALAPMAVAPDHQRQGIGTALIRTALETLQQTKTAAVFVLGHPDYYPRFGFIPASRYNIACEFDAPDEAFMILPLDKNAIAKTSGLMKYHPAFDAFK